MTPTTLPAPPTENKSAAVPDPISRPPAPPQKRGVPWLTITLLFAGAAAAVFFFTRHERSVGETAKLTVAVTKVAREDLDQDIWLSAEFHPYQEISLHSKVAGYLKSISVDVGDQVKAGQKIAELEVPELEDEFAKAQSAYQASLQDVKRAEADYTQANAVFERLQGVIKDHPKLVAQQELDDARAKHDAMNGSLGAAQRRVEERQSEINKTKTLLDYATITVPFEGIITRRYADPGALIQAGTASSTQSMPLVDLAQQDLLRLVFPVPESAAPLIKNGAPVEVNVSSLNAQFSGKISRFSGKVERNTRTMHTEVDVPNPGNKFKPGMYAFVRIILQEEKNALVVPVQAVATGENPSVYILTKDNVIDQRSVTLGLQTPDKVQIREGLNEGDLVIVGSRNGARPGQKAEGKLTESPKAH
ncbi:MAG TPA: efflux RND transporter periplasmic adaptor subunit [Chthoniobacter sp.]|nr:efflux RND transporter periplasmic adaptor subunit [Chthoniobacter sp.]